MRSSGDKAIDFRNGTFAWEVHPFDEKAKEKGWWNGIKF